MAVSCCHPTPKAAPGRGTPGAAEGAGRVQPPRIRGTDPPRARGVPSLVTQPQLSLPSAVVSPGCLNLLFPPLKIDFFSWFPQILLLSAPLPQPSGGAGPAAPAVPREGDTGGRGGVPLPLCPRCLCPVPPRQGRRDTGDASHPWDNAPGSPQGGTQRGWGGGHRSDPQDAGAGTGECRCHHPRPHPCPTRTGGLGGSRGGPSSVHSTPGCSPPPPGRAQPCHRWICPPPQPLFASLMAPPALEFAYEAENIINFWQRAEPARG